MARIKKITLPNGFANLRGENKVQTHFDYADQLLAKEHYGKYLVVKNAKSDFTIGNRLYLCRDSLKEYLSFIGDKTRLVKIKDQPSHTQILTSHKEYKNLIIDVLWKVLKADKSRKVAIALVTGFNLVLEMLKINEYIPSVLEEFDAKHFDIVKQEVSANLYNDSQIKCISRFISAISQHSEKNLPLLRLGQYRSGFNNNEAISSSIVFQLDFYAQKDIDETVKRATEYNIWMKELEAIELFSLSNLAHTFYGNIENLGGDKASSLNSPINRIAQLLHNEDLRCWSYRKRGIIKYENEERKERHRELLEIGKSGININICTEKMLAMWHKTLAPNYPYEGIAEPFIGIWKTGDIYRWLYHQTKKLGTTVSEFESRIFPSSDEIYFFYLFFLIRSGLNQETLKSWKVKIDEFGQYYVGEKSGFGLLFDGEKNRVGKIQSTIFQKSSIEEKNLNFLVKWLEPLYKRSKNVYLFQYINKNCIETFFTRRLITNQQDIKFYKKHNVIKETWIEDKCTQERIRKINHQGIRPAKNFSDYLRGFEAWKRQRNLGHKNAETEHRHYRNSLEWRRMDNLKIAAVQNTIIRYFKGEITSDDDKKLTVFEVPMANCKNPFNPTYEGAPELKEDETCSNWRKCLTGCEQCKVIPRIHGPVIMAWKKCMDGYKKKFLKDEDWMKEFSLDYEAAKSVLKYFKKEDISYCKNEASKYSVFVENMIYISQQKRKA